MAYIGSSPLAAPPLVSGAATLDPRAHMAARIPTILQPFLTWLTAKPAPEEAVTEQPAIRFVTVALLWLLGGCAMTSASLLLHQEWMAFWAFLPIGLIATSCGLGIFQVVIFHHCSHGTVFRTREYNRRAGRLISALLLFKRFDDYQREHMLHHSPKKLLTDEDEFAGFVLGMCGLEPGMSKQMLWRRVIICLFSPMFHMRFLMRRVKASLFTGDQAHDYFGRVVWSAIVITAVSTNTLLEFSIAWVLPLTILLQIATVLRILCEHRFPEAELMDTRDRSFVCHATAGVFPGSFPPEADASRLAGFLLWTKWWCILLTWHLFVRLFVLVGDAPCHDFHHRRPASRRWTSYIHARQQDIDANSPGFATGYSENWGLLTAIDHNLNSLALTLPGTIGH